MKNVKLIVGFASYNPRWWGWEGLLTTMIMQVLQSICYVMMIMD